MLPVLKIASDGNEHRISDVIDRLAVDFNLTEAEQEELLPSGKQPAFNNRVHWAKTYLSQAGLLEATRRSFFKITDRGRSVLAQNVSKIDAKFLRQFPEFNAFVAGGDKSEQKEPGQIDVQAVAESTPDELLRATIKEVESALASDLITRVCNASPAFFERLVVDLLLQMGYGGSRAVIELLEQAGADPLARDDVLHCTPRGFGICVPANWSSYIPPMLAKVRARLAEDPAQR